MQFLYFEVQYTATHFRSRICEVRCERCQCRYFYELRRSGTGTESAPYALNSQEASEGSHQNADRAALESLDSEAELVPCPRCHWVNRSLVRGYRNSCYRGWIETVIGAALLAMGISLLEVPVLWNNGINNGNKLLFWIFVWPLFVVTVAGGFIGGVVWLRRRINPNRNFPEPPNLSPDVPGSLVLDPNSNRLVPAAAFPSDPLNQTTFRFYADRHLMPDECCVCLRSNDGGGGTTLKVFKGWNLWAPICRSCARRKAGYRFGIGVVIVSLIVACGVTLSIRAKLDEKWFWVATGASSLFAVVFASALCPLLFQPVWVLSKDALRGIFRLGFENPDVMHRIRDASATLEFNDESNLDHLNPEIGTMQR